MIAAPTHCTKCGRELILKRRRGQFSASTGDWEPGPERLQCPRIGSFFGIGGTYHDHYLHFDGYGSVPAHWSRGGWR